MFKVFRPLFFLFLLSLVGTPAACFAEILVVPGTGDSQKLLRVLGDFYNQQQTDMVIIPESIGSSGGVRQIQRGKAVLARVARKLTEKEKADGLQWKQFAYSPVVFAVNAKQEQVSNLTSSQVEALFSGKLTDWHDLGAPPGKIFLAEREVGDSSRTILEHFFKTFARPHIPIGEILYSTTEMARVLNRYPQTLGYLPLSAIKGTAIRPLSLDGVVPSPQSMEDNSYPLWVPLALVWKGELKGPARRFFDFLFSPDARQLIEGCNLKPVDP